MTASRLKKVDTSVGFTIEQIDAVVEVRSTQQKGRCLYTKRYLEPGEIIYVESPLLTSSPSLDPELWKCLELAQEQIAMELPPVWHMAALVTLTQLPRSLVEICLDKWIPPDTTEISTDVARVYDLLPGSAKSKVDIQEFQHVLMAWRYNSFGHHSEADGLVMYNRISMMSHSCRSTCCWHYGENDKFILRARVALNVGDELSISYIGDDDLLRSTEYRRTKLQGWMFECMCDRCREPMDTARGFKCPQCGSGVCFLSHEASKVSSKQNSSSIVSSFPCNRCGKPMNSALVDQRLQLELQYAARIEQIEKGNLQDLELVYNQAQNIFEQHWIVYQLSTQMAECFRERNMHSEAVNFQTARIKYHEAVLPWSTYTLAWCYEEVGDVLSQQVGALNDNIAKLSQTMRHIIAGHYEKAYFVLVLLCGESHAYTLSAQHKWWTLHNHDESQPQNNAGHQDVTESSGRVPDH